MSCSIWFKQKTQQQRCKSLEWQMVEPPNDTLEGT